MFILTSVTILLSGPWMSDAYRTLSKEAGQMEMLAKQRPFSYSLLDRSSMPNFGDSGRELTLKGSWMDSSSYPAEGIRHLMTRNPYIGPEDGLRFPNFLKKRVFLNRRASPTTQDSPVPTIDLVGDMKEFFDHLKQSLTENQNHESIPKPEQLLPFAPKLPQGTADNGFAFPQHMRRMMFGMEPLRPYAHSSLGR